MKNILRKQIRKIINETFLSEGIDVFHGTDRDFDEFDLNRIGSGDGKSLGGWGIYFSDSEDVSKRYFTKNGFVKEFVIKSGEYFDLDESLDEWFGEKIKNKLGTLGIDEGELEQFQTDYIDYIPNISNKDVYDWLSYVLDGEKNASLFLEKLGFIGNKFVDKWDRDATNYVLFNPKYIQ